MPFPPPNLYQREQEPTAYLPCFTELSRKLFYIQIRMKSLKEESHLSGGVSLRYANLKDNLVDPDSLENTASGTFGQDN